MKRNFKVNNKGGLKVHNVTSTYSASPRYIPDGEGFKIWPETQTKKGPWGLETWATLENSQPGAQVQEYVCLQIGNKVFAVEVMPELEHDDHPGKLYVDLLQKYYKLEAWAKSKGFIP